MTAKPAKKKAAKVAKAPKIAAAPKPPAVVKAKTAVAPPKAAKAKPAIADKDSKLRQVAKPATKDGAKETIVAPVKAAKKAPVLAAKESLKAPKGAVVPAKPDKTSKSLQPAKAVKPVKPIKPIKPIKVEKKQARPPEPPPTPVKSSLTKKDLEQFRRLLQNKQHDFTEAYRTSKGDSRTDLSNGTEDYIDYAVSSYSKEFLLSLTEMDRRQLQLVQDALRRIDRNEFGLCLQCGQEIPRKRLEVQPWARHCVRCQELEEQGLLRPVAYGADGEEFGEDPLELGEEEFGVSRPARRVVEEDDEEEAEEEEEEVEEEPEPPKVDVEVEPIVIDEEEEVVDADKDKDEEE